MRLATWQKSTPNEYLGFSNYGSCNDSCNHLWLNFRHEDIYTSQADTIRNFGVYVWVGQDATISFTSKMHDVHSADLEQLQSMVKFLRKNAINSPFYKLEGREHLKFLLKEVFAQLKVTEQTNYPSDNITKLDVSAVADKILAHCKGWPAWRF